MGCEPENHSFIGSWWPGGPDRSYDESTHECEEGWCSEAHPETLSCASEQEDALVLNSEQIVDLWNAVKEEDPDALTRLVEAGGSLVSYHASRQAIQVQDCTDQIILSVPLTVAQADLLRN